MTSCAFVVLDPFTFRGLQYREYMAVTALSSCCHKKSSHCDMVLYCYEAI